MGTKTGTGEQGRERGEENRRGERGTQEHIPGTKKEGKEEEMEM